MADVPVGAFLSGGLDSSSVVGIMSDKTDNDVSTYSIEFADSSYNETEYANAVAAEFGTDHDVISTDLSDLDIFEEIVSRMNEPMPDPAILPTTLLASEAATDLKVVQTGSGGDEMFSGYDQWNMIGKHRRWFDSIPGPVFAAAGTMADVSPVYDDHLHYFSSLNDDSRAITNFLTGESFTQSCNTLDWLTFNGDTNITSPETTVREHLTEPNRGSEECVYQFLTGAHLPSRLLHKVDTATMNASLEARVPFLDRDLVEVAMVIPHSVKTDGDYKSVLRKAVEDFVPSVVLKRDKKGFSVPVSEWIEDRRDPIERWISEEKLYATPYVDTEQVRTAYAEHYRGTKSHSRMLFRVLVYVAWYHTVVKPTESSMIKLSP